MLKGCLFLLAILAAAYLLEKRELDRRGLPESGVAAAALGLAVTLTLGTVQGLVQAGRKRAQPQTPREQWQPGQLVRLGGTIRCGGAAALPKTPFTQREAVLFEYEASAPALARGGHSLVWKGMDMAPDTVLDTSQGRLRLTGFPNLRDFPAASLRSRNFLPQAARMLAMTEWKIQPAILAASLAEAERDFANAGGGAMPVNRINRMAAEWLDVEAGRGSEQHFLGRLAQRNWNFSERAVMAGEEVTAVGTYHENPPRVDISLSIRNYEHALHPGSAGKLAAGEQRTAVVFLIVLGLMTLAMHYAVYHADGAWYRGVIRQMRLTL